MKEASGLVGQKKKPEHDPSGVQGKKADAKKNMLRDQEPSSCGGMKKEQGAGSSALLKREGRGQGTSGVQTGNNQSASLGEKKKEAAAGGGKIIRGRRVAEESPAAQKSEATCNRETGRY